MNIARLDCKSEI